MGPLEILLSWQALLVVVGATGLTQLVKTIYDVRKGQASPVDTPTLRSAAKVGKGSRSMLVDRFVLPMCPIVFGACLAMLIPARPDPIMEYVKLHEIGKSALLIYAAWGAVCGQFADYLFSKFKKKLDEFLPRGDDKGAA